MSTLKELERLLKACTLLVIFTFFSVKNFSLFLVSPYKEPLNLLEPVL